MKKITSVVLGFVILLTGFFMQPIESEASYHACLVAQKKVEHSLRNISTYESAIERIKASPSTRDDALNLPGKYRNLERQKEILEDGIERMVRYCISPMVDLASIDWSLSKYFAGQPTESESSVNEESAVNNPENNVGDDIGKYFSDMVKNKNNPSGQHEVIYGFYEDTVVPTTGKMNEAVDKSNEEGLSVDFWDGFMGDFSY